MKVIHDFHDLEDGHNYRAGDEYPYDGRVVSEERIMELSTAQNKAGFALIKAADDPDKGKPFEKTAAAQNVAETPENGTEKPKRATRSRKKAN